MNMYEVNVEKLVEETNSLNRKDIGNFFCTKNALYYPEYEQNFTSLPVEFVKMKVSREENVNQELLGVIDKIVKQIPLLEEFFSKNHALIAGSCANSILMNKPFNKEEQDIDIFVTSGYFLDLIKSFAENPNPGDSDRVYNMNVDGYDVQIVGLHELADPVHLFRKFAFTVQCFSWNPVTNDSYTSSISIFHEEGRILLPLLRTNMSKSYLKSLYKYIGKGYSLIGPNPEMILYEWIQNVDLKKSAFDVKQQPLRY